MSDEQQEPYDVEGREGDGEDGGERANKMFQNSELC